MIAGLLSDFQFIYIVAYLLSFSLFLQKAPRSLVLRSASYFSYSYIVCMTSYEFLLCCSCFLLSPSCYNSVLNIIPCHVTVAVLK